MSWVSTSHVIFPKGSGAKYLRLLVPETKLLMVVGGAKHQVSEVLAPENIRLMVFWAQRPKILKVSCVIRLALYLMEPVLTLPKSPRTQIEGMYPKP